MLDLFMSPSSNDDDGLVDHDPSPCQVEAMEPAAWLAPKRLLNGSMLVEDEDGGEIAAAS